MKTKRIFMAALIAAASMVAMVACGDEPPVTPPNEEHSQNPLVGKTFATLYDSGTGTILNEYFTFTNSTEGIDRTYTEEPDTIFEQFFPFTYTFDNPNGVITYKETEDESYPFSYNATEQSITVRYDMVEIITYHLLQ